MDEGAQGGIRQVPGDDPNFFPAEPVEERHVGREPAGAGEEDRGTRPPLAVEETGELDDLARDRRLQIELGRVRPGRERGRAREGECEREAATGRPERFADRRRGERQGEDPGIERVAVDEARPAADREGRQ